MAMTCIFEKVTLVLLPNKFFFFNKNRYHLISTLGALLSLNINFTSLFAVEFAARFFTDEHTADEHTTAY